MNFKKMRMKYLKLTHPNPWKPEDWCELFERLGKYLMATMPAARANTDAKTKAGMFPPPNKASHGPAPSETIICIICFQTYY